MQIAALLVLRGHGMLVAGDQHAELAGWRYHQPILQVAHQGGKEEVVPRAGVGVGAEHLHVLDGKDDAGGEKAAPPKVGGLQESVNWRKVRRRLDGYCCGRSAG